MTQSSVSACRLPNEPGRERTSDTASREAAPVDLRPVEKRSTTHPDGSTRAAPSRSPAEPDALLLKRPYRWRRPRSGTGERPPLVLFLHGYGASPRRLISALELPELAERLGFAYAVPAGTLDSRARRFWDATPACCNFRGPPVDDVGYLRAVLTDAIARSRADPERVFLYGFSNGGFMAHRLGCEAADIVTAFASISGAGSPDERRCHPARPLSVIEVHGDADEIIRYEGGHPLGRNDLPRHPSARQTVEGWARRLGCGSTPRRVGRVDLEERIQGDETEIERYESCRGGASVELWTVHGGSHFVAIRPSSALTVLRRLLSFRRHHEPDVSSAPPREPPRQSLRLDLPSIRSAP